MQVVRAELVLEVAYFVHNIVVAGKEIAGKEMVDTAVGHRDLVVRTDCMVVGSLAVHMVTVHRVVAVHKVFAVHRAVAVHMVGGRKEIELHKADKVGMAA